MSLQCCLLHSSLLRRITSSRLLCSIVSLLYCLCSPPLMIESAYGQQPSEVPSTFLYSFDFAKLPCFVSAYETGSLFAACPKIIFLLMPFCPHLAAFSHNYSECSLSIFNDPLNQYHLLDAVLPSPYSLITHQLIPQPGYLRGALPSNRSNGTRKLSPCTPESSSASRKPGHLHQPPRPTSPPSCHLVSACCLIPPSDMIEPRCSQALSRAPHPPIIRKSSPRTFTSTPVTR